MISLRTSTAQLTLNIALGCMGVLLYESGVIPPVYFSVILFLLVFAIFASGGFHNRVYSLVSAIFCILPLLHIVGFIISDSYAFYPDFEVSLPDQLNPELRDRLALMGLVTMCGLLAGMLTGLCNKDPASLKMDQQPSRQINTSFAKIAILAIISLIFMHLDAPEQTIFSAAYTESLSTSSALGLGSLFPIAFGLNAMAWYLYFNLKQSLEKTASLYLLIVTTTIIIVFYQLLRGDREFVGLATCLFFLADRFTLLHKRGTQILIVAFVAYFLLQFVGLYRSIAVEDYDLVAGVINFIARGDFFHGTWTAVLLTPLATLGDFYLGQRELLLGQTYLDFVLSIPPTPVADYLGYERPITSFQGPAWEVSYGAGGTYISVVPFFNFSMAGVLLQTFLIGLLVGTIDRKSSSGNSLMWILLGFAIGVVLWGVFWYGEMYLVRSLVTTFPLMVIAWYALGIPTRTLKKSASVRQSMLRLQ